MLFFALSAAVLPMGGCAGQAEEENMVLLYNDEGVEEVAGNLPVEYADVVSTMTISARYRTAVTMDLAFDVERARIDSVLVTAGEEVKKGQLLISVENNKDIQAEREDLLYQIERIGLLKQKTLDQKEHDITVARFDIAMTGVIGRELEEAEKEAIAQIDEKYYFTLQGYEDDLAIAQLKLYNLENSNVDHNIYAGMDGIVDFLRDGLEGSQTVIGRTVITLKDPNDMYFYANDPTLFSYLDGVDEVTISVSGTSAGDYTAMPEMSADGQSLRFILTGDDAASASFAEGTNGNITLELGRSDNALSVPRRAVHTAGDVSFVYVVDEDGYRRYREIKTGLIGDTRIEVLDGLKAGEVVAVNF